MVYQIAYPVTLGMPRTIISQGSVPIVIARIAGQVRFLAIMVYQIAYHATQKTGHPSMNPVNVQNAITPKDGEMQKDLKVR
jgi:hypothetical protein